MKQKLKKFTVFVETLLPQEVVFLSSLQRFDDKVKIDILEQVSSYVLGKIDRLNLDTSIDKRKYSLLMKWMEGRLQRQDVDNQFAWINGLQADIMLDKIEPHQEVAVIKSLSQFKPTHFYFLKYYEMLKELRQHLLVRRQFSSYEKIANFLQAYHFEYQNAVIKRERIDEATKDILIQQYRGNEQIKRWENWMVNSFHDEYSDGHNRYLLFVRLCFIYLETNQLEKLESISNSILRHFNTGEYYSRRLLLNYYDNMLVLYDRKREYQLAEYYGRLSIKGDGQDKLLYFNNYINVLIKQGKYSTALQEIEASPFRLTEHKDLYSVIGHIANHMRCLSQTGKSKLAVKKGEIFWSAYQKDIWKYRWYRFFVAYLEALLSAGQYPKLLRTVKRQRLLEKEQGLDDKQLRSRSTIQLIYTLANYMEGNISSSEVNQSFSKHHRLDHRDALDQELEEWRVREVGR